MHKTFHIVETALLRVQTDILSSIDSNCSVILVLLDLSAAFDTVDHSILLQRLSNGFGLGGIALEWFRSYLSDHSSYVSVYGGK